MNTLVKKRGFTAVAGVIVLALLVFCLKYILSTALILGLGFYDMVKPYEKQTGIESYDKEYLLREYGSDLDSGLFVFPDDTDNALTATYESTLKTGLFDTDGSIFLTATYTDENFEKEIERLSNISCTVFDTDAEDSDYHTSDIIYDTTMYNYPAYVASDGYDYVYEYALADSENNRIIYVLLSYPADLINGAGLIDHMDYLKKDKGAYITNYGSALEKFSIYSFSFSEGIWSEYSPEDENHPRIGKK
ncbi:hypothetical protein UYO_2817 [Lachnospiraceae bacterium JC7]|nr:hypothetical protein UYO_2817 [Lachnospiraceae bacterium JC7]